MWVLNLKLPSEKQFMGKLAIKHQVSMTGYPLSYWKKYGKMYIIAAGVMFGEEKDKRALMRDIKKQKELIKFESDGDFLVAITEQPSFTEPAYDPQIIRPLPVVINKKGYHIWYLACFDRSPLEKVLHFAEKYLNTEVLKFKQEKITNISFTKLLPDLTKSQKKALEIAINEGYYEYPKRVKMEALAKKMGISYSTFQAHLKKAEGKILPEVYKEL